VEHFKVLKCWRVETDPANLTTIMITSEEVLGQHRGRKHVSDTDRCCKTIKLSHGSWPQTALGWPIALYVLGVIPAPPMLLVIQFYANRKFGMMRLRRRRDRAQSCRPDKEDSVLPIGFTVAPKDQYSTCSFRD
jgi:hypothetical protein